MPTKKETAKAKARARARARANNANANQYNPFFILICWFTSFFNSLPSKCQDLLIIFVNFLGIIANLLGMQGILIKLLYSLECCEQLINWGISYLRPDMQLTFPIAYIMNTRPVSLAISVTNYVSMLSTIISLVYAVYLIGIVIGNVVIPWILDLDMCDAFFGRKKLRKRRLQITWDPRYILFFVILMIGVVDARRTIMEGVGQGNNPMSNIGIIEYNAWMRENYPNYFACLMANILCWWFNGEGPAGFPAGCIIWFEWYDEYNKWVVHVQNVKLLMKHMKIATSRTLGRENARYGIVETNDSGPYNYWSDNHRNDLMKRADLVYKFYIEAFDFDDFDRDQINNRRKEKLTVDGSGPRWGAGNSPSQIYDRRHKVHIYIFDRSERQILLCSEKAGPVGRYFFPGVTQHKATEAVVKEMKKKFFELNRSRPIRKVYLSRVLICKARSTPSTARPLDI